MTMAMKRCCSFLAITVVLGAVNANMVDLPEIATCTDLRGVFRPRNGDELSLGYASDFVSRPPARVTASEDGENVLPAWEQGTACSDAPLFLPKSFESAFSLFKGQTAAREGDLEIVSARVIEDEKPFTSDECTCCG